MTQSRKVCRAGDRCRPTSLGEVIYCLVHHSDIEARLLAEMIGVRYGYLLDAANPDRDDAYLQTRLIVPLTIHTGNTVLVEYLAHSVGGAYFPLPESSADSTSNITQAVQRAIQRFGDVLSAVGSSSVLTPDAIADIALSCDDAIGHLAALKHAVGADSLRNVG